MRLLRNLASFVSLKFPSLLVRTSPIRIQQILDLNAIPPQNHLFQAYKSFLFVFRMLEMFAFDQFAIGPNQFVVGKLRIGEKNET